MRHTPLYLFLFAITSLLQIFLFNNLAISGYFCPLIYVVFLIMLPLETPPIAMLGIGLVTGIVMDFTMGISGLNTATAMAVTFVRPYLMHLLSLREDVRDDGIPSRARFGKQLFWGYAIILVLFHHTLFFTLEALSWMHLPYTIFRIVLSSCGTLILVGICERLLASRITTRVL